MNEAERIRALRQQGTIDDAQAARLLDALGELDTIEPPGAGTARDAARHEASHDGHPGDPGDPAAPPHDASSDHAATATSAHEPHAAEPHGPAATANLESDRTAEPRPARATETAVTRWTTLDLLAGDVDVHGDADADRPVLHDPDGDLEIEDTDDGWRVRQKGRGPEGWLDRILDSVSRRTRVRMTVPSDSGVRLAMKAGDVDLDDVPAVCGSLLAGDVEIRGARALDLEVRAGDVDVGLDPAPGLHRLFLTVGDADLRLPPSADATVQARVAIGDVHADPPLAHDRRGLGATVDGALGSGERARIEIGLKTGDLSVKVG